MRCLPRAIRLDPLFYWYDGYFGFRVGFVTVGGRDL